MSVGAESADGRALGAVDVVGLDVLAVSVLFVEPEAVLLDGSIDVLKRLLAVGIGFGNLDASWLVEVVFCEDPLSVDDAAVPTIEPVVVEGEGCTAVVEVSVAVVSGIRVVSGEGFVPDWSPVIAEDRDSAVPNE